MTGSGGTNTACAACKYQRRKCSADCPLSPYFPPDQPKRFQNVHKLFGVSNILRILKHVDPSKREDTVKSIAYEADTREKDPVHGCLGVITLLQNQVAKLREELDIAREQLFMLEQQHNFSQQLQHAAASLAAATGVVHAGSAHGGVLMQQMQQYGGLGGSALSNSNFDDQYLRHVDSFDQPKQADSTSYDMARYVGGEPSGLAGQVKVEQAEQLRRAVIQFGADSAFVDSTTSHHQIQREAMEQEHVMAMRRPGNNLLNLTVASDSDLRRASILSGQPIQDGHELRRAGVYLTLTNQH